MQTDVDNGIGENPTGDNGVETTDGKPRKRKPYRPGIGGFLVRSRNRFINKQKSIPDEGNGDKSVGETAKKPARKKKSKISDNYPQYIQDAFFGSLAQEQKPNPVPTLPTVKMERDASPKFDPSDYLIKPEQVVEPQVRPSTATAPDMKSEAGDVSGCESSLTDEYISIIDLDDDLPQRPESEEEEDITDINFFNFDVVEGDLKEQGVDVSDIFRELEDDGDSEEEEKEESLPSIKSEPGIVVKNEAPPTQPPQPSTSAAAHALAKRANEPRRLSGFESTSAQPPAGDLQPEPKSRSAESERGPSGPSRPSGNVELAASFAADSSPASDSQRPECDAKSNACLSEYVCPHGK